MRAMMRSRRACLGVLISGILLSAACDRGEPQASRPCEPALGTDDVQAEREGVILVRGEDAPCAVEFTPVVTLTGEMDGTLPKLPVVSAPGGRWLTSTYTEGQLALWSPSGQLERLIGRGAGQGPGEFEDVSDLVVDSLAGTVYVFSSKPHVDVFTLNGDFLERVRLPSLASMGIQVGEGIVVTSTAGLPSKFVVIQRDTVLNSGPSPRFPMPAYIEPGDRGVWAVEPPWYEINHYAIPSGQLNRTIRREVDWFPSDRGPGEGPIVFGFNVDHERRLIFVRVLGIPDPAADGRPPTLGREGDGRPPTPGRERGSPEEIDRRYYDGFIEAFSFDGRLVASSRVDGGMELPEPLGDGDVSSLWYRLQDDLTGSIQILRAELVQRTRPDE